MMPSAKKGRKQKRIDRRPVPIPASLACKLSPADPDEVVPSRSCCDRTASHGALPVTVIRSPRPVTRAGLDPAEITIYALRHSSIVRQLLGGVPIRVVATTHDTSVAMIEKTYSRYITDHSDVLSRGAMLDPAKPVSDDATALPASVIGTAF